MVVTDRVSTPGSSFISLKNPVRPGLTKGSPPCNSEMADPQLQGSPDDLQNFPVFQRCVPCPYTGRASRRHTVSAAEIAAVRHGYSHIINRSAQPVNHVSCPLLFIPFHYSLQAEDFQTKERGACAPVKNMPCKASDFNPRLSDLLFQSPKAEDPPKYKFCNPLLIFPK